MKTKSLEQEKINSNIIIQKSAYKMARAMYNAFNVGEIKDGKTTPEWEEYRKTKSELGKVINEQLEKYANTNKITRRKKNNIIKY